MSAPVASSDIRDRGLVRALLNICIGARWVFGAIFVLIIVSTIALPDGALTLGGDPNDPDANWPTVHVGLYVDEKATRAAMIVEAIGGALYTGAGFFILGEMAGILRNVLRGEAFARDNGARLRRMGWIGAGAQLGAYATWIAAVSLDAAGAANTDGVFIQLSPTPWIGVLSAFALSTVFRQGASLKEEQDLTV